ncbi:MULTISPECIES: hemolysin XhlA [unclassified Clostridium]|uniref:hemolysin XhlA n=1 Tax=unclassified Clostridium TaxID=2614128 RepID=UPI002079EB44|nr:MULTISPECIES: hemolysin XhlA [unclassified Clostridium]
MNEVDTIQEIKERLVRIEILLEKNTENWGEKINVANNRIRDLEDTIKWISRTAIGGLLTGLLGILFSLIKFGGM